MVFVNGCPGCSNVNVLPSSEACAVFSEELMFSEEDWTLLSSDWVSRDATSPTLLTAFGIPNPCPSFGLRVCNGNLGITTSRNGGKKISIRHLAFGRTGQSDSDRIVTRKCN